MKESLGDVKLNFGDYLDIFRNWKKDKKVKEKELQKKEKELREKIVEFFDKKGKEWAGQYKGLKNKGIDILFEEAVFKEILKPKYENEKETKIIDKSTGEVISIFDSWKGFTGYFDKFFATRKNFYKDEAENGHGKSGQISTRIIDQNLKRFCDNILIFENLKEKIDFTEIEHNFGRSLSETFSLEFYNSCLLQDGINFYNKILGGETLENGEKLKGLNEIINKYRQDHKGEKPQFFKLLDKQILSEKEKFTDEIENEKEFLEILKSFYNSVEKKIKILQNLFKNFSKNQEYDFSQIYLSKEAFNTISRKWTFETEIFEEKLFEVLKTEKIISSSAKKKDGGYYFPDFISLSSIKFALEKSFTEKFWKERYYKSDENKKGFLELTNKENVWMKKRERIGEIMKRFFRKVYWQKKLTKSKI